MKTLLSIMLILFSFNGIQAQCDPDTIPPEFIPYPPALITVSDMSDLMIPQIQAVDNCSDASVSYTISPATGCNTLECHAIEWTSIDSSGNISVAYTFIEVSDPLSIQEQILDPLNVFPNPSNGQFTVTGSDDWKIFDVYGRRMDPDQLDPGTYVIKAGSRSKRLIIQ